MSNTITIQSQLTQEVLTWQSRINTAGGGFEWNSIAIANQFIRAIKGKSYFTKIQYLLPMLGKGINAARIPLIDRLNVGGATNTNFVDADFNQSTGLQGNGSNKLLNSLITPGQLGTSNNGGLGWWENNISFAGNGSEVMGAYSNDASNRYSIDLRNFTAFFPWGSPGNNAGNGGNPATNGHYYGNRSSATSRVFYKNASQTGTNSANDSASGASERNIYIMAINDGTTFYWPGRCAVTYLTDGTFSSDEIIDFDIVLREYLLGPTGKPQS